eukprot:1077802-Pleurochrysis_carterae.AAC.1
MSAPSDIPQPLGCSARARSALAAARYAVGHLLASEGSIGEGLAMIQSAAGDASGLDLGLQALASAKPPPGGWGRRSAGRGRGGH